MADDCIKVSSGQGQPQKVNLNILIKLDKPKGKQGACGDRPQQKPTAAQPQQQQLRYQTLPCGCVVAYGCPAPPCCPPPCCCPCCCCCRGGGQYNPNESGNERRKRREKGGFRRNIPASSTSVAGCQTGASAVASRKGRKSVERSCQTFQPEGQQAGRASTMSVRPSRSCQDRCKRAPSRREEKASQFNVEGAPSIMGGVAPSSVGFRPASALRRSEAAPSISGRPSVRTVYPAGPNEVKFDDGGISARESIAPAISFAVPMEESSPPDPSARNSRPSTAPGGGWDFPSAEPSRALPSVPPNTQFSLAGEGSSCGLPAPVPSWEPPQCPDYPPITSYYNLEVPAATSSIIDIVNTAENDFEQIRRRTEEAARRSIDFGLSSCVLPVPVPSSSTRKSRNVFTSRSSKSRMNLDTIPEDTEECPIEEVYGNHNPAQCQIMDEQANCCQLASSLEPDCSELEPECEPECESDDDDDDEGADDNYGRNGRQGQQQGRNQQNQPNCGQGLSDYVGTGWEAFDRFCDIVNNEPFPNPCMNRCDDYEGLGGDTDLATFGNGSRTGSGRNGPGTGGGGRGGPGGGGGRGPGGGPSGGGPGGGGTGGGGPSGGGPGGGGGSGGPGGGGRGSVAGGGRSSVAGGGAGAWGGGGPGTGREGSPGGWGGGVGGSVTGGGGEGGDGWRSRMQFRDDPYQQETYILLLALPLVILGLMCSFRCPSSSSC